MSDHLALTERTVLLSRDDKKLVDEAVVTITRLWREGLLGTVVALGDYLLETFFDGMLELAAANRPYKPNALRHLYQRVAELPVGIHQLRLAIRIAAQWHLLPVAVADALTVSHHEVLLRIVDPTDKERLAREALAKRLSVDALARLARRLRPMHRGGRPPLPPAVRWAKAFAQVVDREELDNALDDQEMRRLSAAQVKTLESDLRRARDRIDHAIERCAQHTRRVGPRR